MTTEEIRALVTSVTSILALCVSLYVFSKQNRQARITLAATLMRDYERDFFSSPEFKKRRLTASKFLFERKSGQIAPVEAFEILDFFDVLGLHINRGSVDIEIAWSGFHYWFDKYWFLLSSDVEWLYKNRTCGVKYLEHCATLHTRMTEFGTKHKGLPATEVRLSDEEIRAFLLEEMDSCQDA